MATPSFDIRVEQRVKSVIALLMHRPITEKIALEIGEIEGFGQLEIVHGEWVGFNEGSYMTGEQQGRIEMRLLLAIGNHVEANDLGQVYPGDTDFVLSGNPESLEERRQPDVAFVKKSRMQKTSGYFYGAPDLAIEIVSPTQKRPKMVEKANIYLYWGTEQVWLVFPKDKTIEVHTADDIPIVYEFGDTLNGELLPDLIIEVSKIFAE